MRPYFDLRKVTKSGADSYGISAMELQGAVTIFVVNLKRIMKMMAK